jgi:hypothetical protein
VEGTGGGIWLTAGSLIEDMKTAKQTNSCRESHNGCKATTAYMRRACSLHDPEGDGSSRGHTASHGPVGRPGISEHPFQMPEKDVSL